MEKIVAGMAALRPRAKAMEAAIRSLYDQVNEFHICLTGWKEKPFEDQKITWSFQSGEYGDAGKFRFVEQVEGLYFSCDDDLIYPGNCLMKLKKQLQKDSNSFVGVHGSDLLTPIRSYYTSRRVYHCLQTVLGTVQAHILGTGIMLFDTRNNPLKVTDFPIKNMADVWVALFAQVNKSPMFVVKHAEGWIKQSPINLHQTIYNQHRLNDRPQTQAVKSINWIKPQKRRSHHTAPP
tara:strand:+ start:1195 stop:1899 length:705 start_codon:yes stop_codon:yes gene_type:complete